MTEQQKAREADLVRRLQECRTFADAKRVSGELDRLGSKVPYSIHSRSDSRCVVTIGVDEPERRPAGHGSNRALDSAADVVYQTGRTVERR